MKLKGQTNIVFRMVSSICFRVFSLDGGEYRGAVFTILGPCGLLFRKNVTEGMKC